MNSGYCAWCGKKVLRFRARNHEPYKYCSPECDKQSMAKRIREAVRLKHDQPKPQVSWVARIKKWFQA